MGPFHTIVPRALERGRRSARRVARPDVEPHLIGRDLADADRARPVGLSSPAATTASTGSTDLHAAAARRAPASARAVSMRSGSTQRRADAVAERAQERERHAAADQRARRRASRCSTSAILSDTLAPPSTADQRALRRARGCGRAPPAPARMSRPAAAGLQVAGDGLDRGVGAVGGGEGVVDVDVGQRGQRAGEAVVVRLLLGMEAQVLEQEDLARLRARGPAPPTSGPTQSGASGTGRPSSAASRSATARASTSDRARPWAGPRWEARTTDGAAPRAQWRIVGSTAVSRVSSVTAPPLERHVEVGAQEDAPARRGSTLTRSDELQRGPATAILPM